MEIPKGCYRPITFDRMYEFQDKFRIHIDYYLTKLKVTRRFLEFMASEHELHTNRLERFMNVDESERSREFMAYMSKFPNIERIDAFVYSLVKTDQHELAKSTDLEMYWKYTHRYA